MGQGIENRITTVLIVEDEPLIRMSAVDLVEEAGFEAIEASGADEAIAILEQRPDIHIVFTDIHMAGSMDGLQLVAYAKDRWPPLRFIVVSGERKVTLQELPEGSCFFSKPYDTAIIGKALHSLAA